MRNQQPGVPQPHQRQQQGLNDVQLWQQHFMYKQLQELQRQQQLQQLDQEARKQNSLSQHTAITKQGADDQLPAFVNGAPVHDSSNYVWPGDLMAGDSKIPSSSQMFMVGNMNWLQRGGSSAMQGFPNGLILSQDQSQALQTMGLVPEQLDQSLYGASVASTRGSLNQYPQSLGSPHDGTDTLMKASGNQADKPVMQSSAFNSFQNDQSSVFPDQFCLQDAVSVSKQGFQGKNLLGHVPLQAQNNGIVSGNFQQLNSLPRNVTAHEIQGREERAGWAGILQEKSATQVGTSHGMVNLDPTEEKILFNDDGIWDSSFGRTSASGTIGLLPGNQLEGTDCLNIFPSVQSGSWSALMQSAVAEASSSDTGLQDEWGSLSFQKMEGSSGNHPSADEGKQTTTWVDSNLQTAPSLTSRPFPLFDDANMSPSGCGIPGFQQPSTKFSFEQSERVRTGSSNDALQQSPKYSGKWLDQGSQQKPLLEGNIQVQTPMHLGNAFEGVWASRNIEQSRNAGNSDIELNPQNMPDCWSQQQSATSYNIGNQSCSKANGWNMNEALSPRADGMSKICDSESPVQHARSNERNRAMHMERDHDGGMWKSTGSRVSVSFTRSTAGVERLKSGAGSPQVHTEDSYMGHFAVLPNTSSSKINQEMNQQVLGSNRLDYRKHAILDSSVKYRGNENVGKYQHQQSMSRVQESSMNNSDRVSGETFDRWQENSLQKEISNDSYTSGNSHSGQRSVTGGSMRDNAWFGSNDSRSSGSGNQKSAGPIGRKPSGVRRFQYHPMGNVGLDIEDSDATKLGMQPQGSSQAVSRVPKSQEQGYFGQSKFVGQAVSNSTVNMDKRNGKAGEDVPLRGFHPGYDTAISASFDGSTAFPALKRTGPTSQNMLELLHKVDQSTENTVTGIGSSDENSSDVAEAAPSDASIAHLQRSYSSASQGFGLQLAPPSQRLPISNNVLSSQTSSQAFNDLISRRIDPEVGDRGQTWMAVSSSQSLPLIHEVSQREYRDNKSSMSGQTGNEMSHPNIQGNSTVTAPISYPKNQQYLLNASGQAANNHSMNLSFGSQPDMNANSKLATYFRQTHDSHDGTPTDQSAHVSFSGVASRLSPFNLGPHPESQIGIASAQAYSTGTGHSQPGNMNPSYQRNSGQDPVSHPPVTSGMHQQGAFSTRLDNAWTNVPAQQHSSGTAPHKVPPNIFQSIGPSTNNLGPNSWTPNKDDDQSLKNGGNGPSEFGACTINSQHFTYGEEQLGKENSVRQQSSERIDLASQRDIAAQGRELVAKHLGDTNPAASNKLIHSHQQDHGKGKHGQEPPLVTQAEHISLRSGSTSNNEIEAFGRSLKPSEVLRQNYALLHQMQAMKGSETDPSRKGVKRLREAESDGDVQHTIAKTGRRFLYGYNSMARDAADDELNATSRPSFPSSDAKMLCFSLEGKDGQNVNPSSQIHVKDVPSHAQSHSSHHIIPPTCTRGTEHAKIDPQMAPSWFEQYGTYKNGQILAMYDGLNSSRRAAKAAAQQFYFGKVSDSQHAHSMGDQASAGDASACKTPTNMMTAKEYFPSPQPLPLVAVEQGLVVARPKKRKTMSSMLRPWHKEVTQGSERLQNISMAELDWARAANRLIEKVEDEADLIDDLPVMPQPRRRLILTTQLIQQLLRSIPSTILSTEATSQYESVTYFAAKLALGDACGSLVSCSGRDDTHVPSEDRNMLSGNLEASEMVGIQFFLKVVEDFIVRAKKLEDDLLRLDKRPSILDIRVECQDLDKFAMVNRFARFHGRSNTDGAESSSSEATVRKMFPQRYVTALSVPRNLPEEVLCLSL